ncbi:hypothetical protein CHRYSEOSP005_30140 [Chryseobacterium sp. Alg-005]|uniref:hypothetical protein n=1 Tax=Chryseobacterium sp. Alg-005 TaxID=3159516 RepID=UPI003555B97A
MVRFFVKGQYGITQPRQYKVYNVRIRMESNVHRLLETGEIVENNNYYPFGMLHNYTATTQNAYQYKFNGKEFQESGMYDFGA